MSAIPPLPTFVRGLPLTRAAVDYAAALHSGQQRESDLAPFILHPLEVASLLHNTGHTDRVVAAGVLHDVVEDTDAAASDLERRFGSAVCALVAAVTEDAAIEPYAERKAALRRQVAAAGPEAAALYAADKVAKVRELRASLAAQRSGGRSPEPGVHPDPDKLAHYEESLAMLEEVLTHHPLVRQLRFELEMLRHAPPGPRRRFGSPPQAARRVASSVGASTRA